MRRRQALAWVGSGALLPQAHSAGTTRRIGFLGGVAPDANVRRTMIDPFEAALRQRGYTLGHDLIVDYRWAAGQPDRLPGLLGELLRFEPDLLVAAGPRPAIVAKTAPRTLPVVADQILKGARPAEIPFEQATKLELVVNLQAARALGITVPQALLASADEVLQ